MRIRNRFSDENEVTLFHGDCLRLLKKIPDRSVKLIVASPPYNVGKSYEERSTFDQYLQSQKDVISECVRILRIGGSICWQVGHCIPSQNEVLPLDIALYPLFAQHDVLTLRNRIVWHFEHGLNCSRRFSGRHETILWFTRGKRYAFELDAVRVPQKYPGKKAYKGVRRGEYSSNPLGKNPGDVWCFPNVKSRHVEKTEHPCQFPIALPERLILALTKKDDLVVDPYMGAGTTGVAAVMHERRFAGSDICRDYRELARQRIKMAANGQIPYRPLKKPVYQPPPDTSLTRSPFNENGSA